MGTVGARAGRGGGVATTTLGYGLFTPATLGIDRLLAREPLLYAGGGGDVTWIFEFFRDSDLGVFGGSSAMLPFRLSLDPPSVRRDIIRCSRPDRVLDDSNEITLAFMLGLYAGSSGGPASKNAIRSCAAREICGLLPPGLRGEEGGSEGGERARPALGWGGATASCIISSSPRISSSSTRLDTGDGVDVVVCRLVEGEAIACAMLWLVEAIALRVVASEILGLRSLRPFDGDSAEKR